MNSWSPRTTRQRISVLVCWLLILVVYAITDRPLQIIDVESIALLPLSIRQEGDLDLDEYAKRLEGKNIARPQNGRLVASFPIWPAFQLLPVYLAQELVDHFPTADEIWPAQRRAAWLFMSLTTLMVGLLIAREYGLGPGLLIGFAFGFGTINWFVLSQLAFANGLVQFWLALALLLTFRRDDPPVWKTALACCALVITVFMRLHMALVALPWIMYLLLRPPRRRMWVPAIAATLTTILLAAGNYAYGGHPMGMYGRHIAKGWFDSPSADLLTTLAANLVSPARGLLVFSPWVILALAAPLLIRRQRRLMPTILLGGWLLHLLAVANHRYWHGGGSGGPRLTADLLPLLALLAAPGISALLSRRWLTPLPLLLIGWSVVIAGAHAFSPPPVWEQYTVPVRICTARLFDWQDPLLTFPFGDRTRPHEQRFPIRLGTPVRNETVRGPVAGFSWQSLPGEDRLYSVELCVRMRGNTFLPKVIGCPAGSDLHLDLDYRALPPFIPGPMSWRVAAYDRRGRCTARSGWRAVWWNYGYPR